MNRSSTVRSENFENALERFEAIDCEDPRKIENGGTEIAWSLLYHRRLQYWVEQLSENPSEALANIKSELQEAKNTPEQ